MRLRGWLAALIFLHLVPFAVRSSLIGGDEPHYALMSHSIAVDHDVDLANNYQDVREGSAAAGRRRAGQTLDRHVRRIREVEVPIHPLGLPLLAAPFLWVKEKVVPGAAPDLILGLLTLTVTLAALLSGWRLLTRYLQSRRIAACIVFGTYFSTPLWFYSRTFFTEPWIWSWIVLGVSCLAGGRAVLGGFLLALALAMKESALLLVLPVLVAFAVLRGLSAAGRAAIGSVVFAILFVAKNILVAGTPFSTFYPFLMGDPLGGAIGLLVDSRHGLLWFAPLLPLAILGWLTPSRNRLDRVLGLGAAVAFLAYFLLNAAWVDWRGGSSFGPRLMVPALPLLTIPLARLWMHPQRQRFSVPFIALFLAGFVIHWSAALDPFAAFWEMSAIELIVDDTLATVAGLIVGAGLMYFARSESLDEACSERAGSTST